MNTILEDSKKLCLSREEVTRMREMSKVIGSCDTELKYVVVRYMYICVLCASDVPNHLTNVKIHVC